MSHGSSASQPPYQAQIPKRVGPEKQDGFTPEGGSKNNVPGEKCISVIVPVLNEAMHIQGTIKSLLKQNSSPLALEILLIDGGSRDGTREIIRRLAHTHPSIKLLDNPRRVTPAALNIGLRSARGQYVGIFGAHCSYPRDYVRICWEELETHDAVGCSGRLLTVPANRTLPARLAAWCMGHRFASSRASVRTRSEGYANTIPYPVFRKQALVDAGGYDESLVRNQDNEMNQRLRTKGYELYLTARTYATYYARPGIAGLLAHAYKTGQWNGKTVRRRGGLSPYHFVPLAFFALVLASLALVPVLINRSGLSSPLLLVVVLPIAAHLSIGMIAGVETAIHQRSAGALLLCPVILAFHLAYGIGTAVGLLKRLVPQRSSVAPPGEVVNEQQ